MTQPTDQQRREVLFRGHVQGVGFRYTTREIAERFRVTGYVCNLPDGRVEVVCEGFPAELDRFIQAITDEMERHIVGVETETSAATGDFSGFDIRH